MLPCHRIGCIWTKWLPPGHHGENTFDWNLCLRKMTSCVWRGKRNYFRLEKCNTRYLFLIRKDFLTVGSRKLWVRANLHLGVGNVIVVFSSGIFKPDTLDLKLSKDTKALDFFCLWLIFSHFLLLEYWFIVVCFTHWFPTKSGFALLWIFVSGSLICCCLGCYWHLSSQVKVREVSNPCNAHSPPNTDLSPCYVTGKSGKLQSYQIVSV